MEISSINLTSPLGAGSPHIWNVGPEHTLMMVKVALHQAVINAMGAFRESISRLKHDSDKANTRKHLENRYVRQVLSAHVSRKLDWGRLSANVSKSGQHLKGLV